jgi:PHP family Zn ribbon phosphoesterase
MTSEARESLRDYVADLHVHTVLSPCAAAEMIPPLIVQEALTRDINLIAIADHNASANVEAVQKAAAGTDLIVLPGMELQTYEEVHLLCLFDTLAQLEAWQEIVDAQMPALENVPESFGEQFVVDETGEFVRHEMRLLVTSANIRLKDAVTEVVHRGGLAIPAHVDRPVFSLFANLGFVPRDVPVDALEISHHITPAAACSKFPDLTDLPLIQSGDVHHLGDLAATTVFTLATPTIAEIKFALQNQKGRSCKIVSR